VLRVRNLHCGYGSLRVIRGVSFHVAPGETVALVGANGSGKTTTLNAVAGLLAPWEGEIRIAGRDTTRQPAWKNVFNSAVLVPEGRQIFGDMTVSENLEIGGFRNPGRDVVIEDVYERFPRLRERSHQLAGTLSGGEQQMLAIGRALVAKPKLLLLDEPSMGLAPLLVRRVFKAIEELKQDGVTVFLVEQNAVAALEIADRGYVLETGEIVVEGEASDLLHNPEVKRAYLGKGYKEVWE